MAPNSIGTERHIAELAISEINRILRCHEPCEIARIGADFDHYGPGLHTEKDSLAERAGFEPPEPFIYVALGIQWKRKGPDPSSRPLISWCDVTSSALTFSRAQPSHNAY